MKTTNEKQKQSGNGFALRLVLPILLTLGVIGLIVGIIGTYLTSHFNSFWEWSEQESWPTVYIYPSDSEHQSETELIDSNFQNEWTSISLNRFSATVDFKESNGGTYYRNFSVVSEDAVAKTFTYKYDDTGETFTVSYAELTVYQRYIDANGFINDMHILVMFLALFSVVGTAFAALLYACAFLGKKHKWANVVSIVFGSIFSVFYFLGVFSIVGGVKGLKSLKKENAAAEGSSVPEAEEETVPAEGAPADTPAATKTLSDYPVDYEHKPVVSQVLDKNNTDNLVLQSENDVTAEFRQLYVNVYGGKLYLVAETVDIAEEDGGGTVVFEVDYENDRFLVEQDEEIIHAVYSEFQAASAGVNLDRKDVKRSEFLLDLYDTSVDERTWKEFKREASQEELAVIAIGAKYRIAHSRIKNILYALGIILSIAIFWPTGGWSLIGYPIFAFLATKAIRYQDTYSQSYRKLSAEYKSFVDNCYNSSVGLTIVDGLVQFATFWLTIPYQAIMILIGTFAPNFAISKNGILVSIPNGFDVGNLGAVGAYYKSFNFIDETLANTKSNAAAKSESSPTDDYYKRDEFTYTDSNGYAQTVYIDSNGKDAYDAGGHYVGTVSGKGSERKFTPSDSSK